MELTADEQDILVHVFAASICMIFENVEQLPLAHRVKALEETKAIYAKISGRTWIGDSAENLLGFEIDQT